MLSVIIPTINEEERIGRLLGSLQCFRERGHEIVLVDGGSDDKTVSVSDSLVDKLLIVEPGRGYQMNFGVAHASGGWLWFLHADSILSDALCEYVLNFFDRITEAERSLTLEPVNKSKIGMKIARENTEAREFFQLGWGRCDVKLSGAHPVFRVVEQMMNIRSSFTSICTGDQGIMVRRSLYYAVGGFPEWPLMEDLALSKRLKKTGRAFRIRERIETSSRRWEDSGVIKTILKMWALRFAFSIGVSPFRLKEYY